MKPTSADLRIDRECNWTANGRPVVHEKIFALFCRSLVRDGDAYFIRIGDEENPVIVEDAPFCVKKIFPENTGDGTDVIHIVLNDGRCVPLDPESLRAADDQSIYCSIPGAGMHARFSKFALTQLGDYIGHDSARNLYYVELNEKKHYLEMGKQDER